MRMGRTVIQFILAFAFVHPIVISSPGRDVSTDSFLLSLSLLLFTSALSPTLCPHCLSWTFDLSHRDQHCHRRPNCRQQPPADSPRLPATPRPGFACVSRRSRRTASHHHHRRLVSSAARSSVDGLICATCKQGRTGARRPKLTSPPPKSEAGIVFVAGHVRRPPLPHDVCQLLPNLSCAPRPMRCRPQLPP